MAKSDMLDARLRTVGLFLTVAFTVSWAYTGAYERFLDPYLAGTIPGRITPYLAAWGPLLAVILVVRLSTVDVRTWLEHQLDYRNPRWVYAMALLLPNAISSAAMLVLPLHGIAIEPSISAGNFVLVFTFTLLLLGALEEFGWRGFLQPTLQARFNPTLAALAVGTIWGIWHLPSFLLGALGDMNLWLFLAHLLPMSVVMAWLYNYSRGLLPVMVFHAAHNAPGNVFAASGNVPPAVSARYYPVYVALWMAVGAALLATTGTTLAADESDQTTGWRPRTLTQD